MTGEVARDGSWSAQDQLADYRTGISETGAREDGVEDPEVADSQLISSVRQNGHRNLLGVSVDVASARSRRSLQTSILEVLVNERRSVICVSV
jgi:hypothetical protein